MIRTAIYFRLVGGVRTEVHLVEKEIARHARIISKEITPQEAIFGVMTNRMTELVTGLLRLEAELEYTLLHKMEF